MEDRIICNCFGTTYNDIKKAIEEGSKTLEEVKDATGAGTACGVCEDEIQEVIDEVLGN